MRKKSKKPLQELKIFAAPCVISNTNKCKVICEKGMILSDMVNKERGQMDIIIMPNQMSKVKLDNLHFSKSEHYICYLSTPAGGECVAIPLPIMVPVCLPPASGGIPLSHHIYALQCYTLPLDPCNIPSGKWSPSSQRLFVSLFSFYFSLTPQTTQFHIKFINKNHHMCSAYTPPA